MYLTLIRLFAAWCINGLKKSTHTKSGRTYIYLLLSAFRIELQANRYVKLVET